MLKPTFFLTFILSTFLSFGGIVEDSTTVDSNVYTHVTRRAAIFSAIIPGSGQIYNEIGHRKVSNRKNRAWWKVPLIYGGLGACGYYFYQNNKWANLTKQEYLFQEKNPGSILDERFTGYSTSQLLNGDDNSFAGYDNFARNRDLLIFGFVGIWALNVIEAYVDAHFVSFDVSDDLSMSWNPTVIGNQAPGVSLRLNFN